MRLLLICLFFFAGLAHAAKNRPLCVSTLTILNHSNPDRYSVEDGRFFVTAEIMPNGVSFLGEPVPGQRTLSINLHLKDKHGRSQLRGKEEFQKVLKHFEGRFDQIRGVWMEPIGRAELSDNLAEINRLTQGPNALAPEEAARQTWSGQQAVAAGYSKVEIQELDGEPGHYTEVTVLFKKP